MNFYLTWISITKEKQSVSSNQWMSFCAEITMIYYVQLIKISVEIYECKSRINLIFDEIPAHSNTFQQENKISIHSKSLDDMIMW